MHSTLKISQYNLIQILLISFPVLPFYFMVGNICVSNILVVIVGCLGLCVILQNHALSIKIDGPQLILFIWVGVRFIAYELYGDYMEGVWFLFRTLICGFVVISGIKSRDSFLKSIRILVYTSGVIACFGIIESTTQFNIFSLINTAGTALNYNPLRFGLLRILSFTSQTIVYCIYCMFMASMAFYLLSIEQRKRERHILLLIYILLWINGLLTLSRSAILAFIVSQLLLLYGCGYTKFIIRIFQIVFCGILCYLILGFIFPQIRTVGQNLVFMILAVFNDNYADTITSSYGSDNLKGIGNRFQLYSWVWESIKGHTVWGMGSRTAFEYQYTAHYGFYDVPSTKTSIEVQYLYVLFHYGIIGLVSEVFAYVAILWKSIKSNFKPASWEGNISFSFVCAVVFFVYFMAMFAVNQSSEARIFYILVFLLLTYCNKYKFDAQ